MFVSYEAKTIEEINFKTDLRGCLKMTFLSFLKEIFDDETALQGIDFVKNMFRELANENRLYIKNKMTHLLEMMA